MKCLKKIKKNAIIDIYNNNNISINENYKKYIYFFFK